MREEGEKLTFIVRWSDHVSGLEKKFNLVFYPGESSVEMVDLRTNKLFLRKIKTDEVQSKDLFLGNTLTVLSRKLVVIDYGDRETASLVQPEKQNTFAFIKTPALRELGKLLEEIYDNGLTISHAKLVKLTSSLAEALCKDSLGSADHPERVASLLVGPCLALVLVGENAVEKWRSGLGPLDLNQAQSEQPQSIRARFGSPGSGIEAVAHASASESEAMREIELFFPFSPDTTANSFYKASSVSQMKDSTCCVILPHAVRSLQSGRIISAIQESGFAVTGFQGFNLDFGKAEEFLEVYKGVVENYGEMVKELCSGLCFALEIVFQTNDNRDISYRGDIVSAFREFVGPRDPRLARTLRPNSLRARFGPEDSNGVKTGGEGWCGVVHCTDLPEDGPLEVQYFFQILQ